MAQDQGAWAKLQNLKNLLNAGFITEDEYKERKAQLVDQLTGTTGSAGASEAPTKVLPRDFPLVVPRAPPDFSTVEEERALKLEFNVYTRQWTQRPVQVKIDPVPFARGTLRLVFHMQEVGAEATSLEDEKRAFESTRRAADRRRRKPSRSTAAVAAAAAAAPPPPPPPAASMGGVGLSGSRAAAAAMAAAAAGPVAFPLPRPIGQDGEDDVDDAAGESNSFVAKIAMDPTDQQQRELYFRDVEMQALAGIYAQKFNECGPPKRVRFVSAWIVQLLEREGQPLAAVERFISGPYRKHNNNYGFVSEDERSTPQAYSHFTYEASAHRLLIVDIQGVSDFYTDPQIHSADGRGFGKGNRGQAGIDKFLRSHRCNAVCRYLKLPSVNANYQEESGTLPLTQYMPREPEPAGDLAEELEATIRASATATTPLLPPIVRVGGGPARTSSAGPPPPRQRTAARGGDGGACNCCVVG